MKKLLVVFMALVPIVAKMSPNINSSDKLFMIFTF